MIKFGSIYFIKKIRQRNIQILNELRQGKSPSELASKYKISRSLISSIPMKIEKLQKRNKNWGNLSAYTTYILEKRLGFQCLKHFLDSGIKQEKFLMLKGVGWTTLRDIQNKTGKFLKRADQ